MHMVYVHRSRKGEDVLLGSNIVGACRDIEGYFLNTSARGSHCERANDVHVIIVRCRGAARRINQGGAHGFGIYQ